MRSAYYLQAVADRVLGLVPPRRDARTRRSRRNDYILAAAMLFASATGSIGAIGLWAAGHGVAGLRVFCGAVLALLLLLRWR